MGEEEEEEKGNGIWAASLSAHMRARSCVAIFHFYIYICIVEKVSWRSYLGGGIMEKESFCLIDKTGVGTAIAIISLVMVCACCFHKHG